MRIRGLKILDAHPIMTPSKMTEDVQNKKISSFILLILSQLQ